MIAWQNITWLNFHKIQNFICIQTYDRPNFKKPERKRTFMSTEKEGGEGGSSNLVRVFRLHYFKQQIYSSFWRMVDVGESFLGHFFVGVIKSIIIYIEAHLYTSYCCFFLECLTFHSIQNPKNPDPILWDFVSWCMHRDNNLRVHSKLSNIMDSF